MSKSPVNESAKLDTLNACVDQKMDKSANSSDALESEYFLAPSVPDELTVYTTKNKCSQHKTTQTDTTKCLQINKVEQIESETCDPANLSGLVEHIGQGSTCQDGIFAHGTCCCQSVANPPKFENLSSVNSLGASGTSPKNPTETLEIVKNNFWKTISDLYNYNPGMTVAMLGKFTINIFVTV